MKVKTTNVTEGETSVEIDLFEGRKLPAKAKRRIQDEVGNFLVEQTLVFMNEKKSPVAGEGSFKALSPEYKKRKLSEVGSGEANLEFDGVLKDSLDFEPTKNGVSIGVFGERAPAADGHNNLSGRSKLPTRRFLPDEGQKYKQQIEREVERIIADVIAEELGFDEDTFDGVTTKRELYERLKKVFGDLTRPELQLAVFRNEDMTNLLKRLDLLGLL